MDTRYLESFIKVAELGSIAAAARLLDLTPTAVSLRIKALESEVGIALIERAGRTVKPTQAGSKVLKQAAVVLREVKNFSSLASNDELPAGPLLLGSTPSGLKSIVPPILRKWVGKYKNIEILIEPASSTVLYERVMQGQLDAAVLVHPWFEMPKTVGWKLLKKEQLILLTPSEIHEGEPFSIINRHPFIRYDRRVVGGKMADDYLRLHNVYPRASFELDGLEYIAELVKARLGVSVIPDWSRDADFEPSLRRHPLPEPVPTRSVGVMWLRAGPNAKLVEAFLELHPYAFF